MTQLSVVVPTFNERHNIEPLLVALRQALSGLDWECVVVDDDSPDGTAEFVRSIAQTEPRIRVIQRIGRRGLSSACIEGMLSTSSPILAVMDGDLQHDPATIPLLLAEIEKGADIAVATRAPQGGLDSMTYWRRRCSEYAASLSRVVLRHNLNDPMSGFFALRREVFTRSVDRLSGVGFKILLDLILSVRGDVNIVEVPYVFGTRNTGESKFDVNSARDFLILLIDKSIGRYIPTEFIAFGFVGGLGVACHFAILIIAFQVARIDFVTSQAIATFGAIVFNFTLNNLFTFRDRILKGFDWLRGLVIFSLASAVGAAANVGVAGFLFSQGGLDWSLSALAGIMFSAVWNYVLSQTYVWRR